MSWCSQMKKGLFSYRLFCPKEIFLNLLFYFFFISVYRVLNKLSEYTFFLISNFIFGVNVRVAQEIYIFKVKSCLGVAQQIQKFSTICLMLPVSTLNSTHNKAVSKTVVEKFSFSKLKTEKVNIFTQSLTKIFCSSVFSIGVCLASCLIFRPFLRLDPQQLSCL